MIELQCLYLHKFSSKLVSIWDPICVHSTSFWWLKNSIVQGSGVHNQKLNNKKKNMNLSDYDLRKENIWETAKNPDLPQWFFAFSGTWLAICWFVGVGMNGIVLFVFAINKEVKLYILIS